MCAILVVPRGGSRKATLRHRSIVALVVGATVRRSTSAAAIDEVDCCSAGGTGNQRQWRRPAVATARHFVGARRRVAMVHDLEVQLRPDRDSRSQAKAARGGGLLVLFGVGSGDEAQGSTIGRAGKARRGQGYASRSTASGGWPDAAKYSADGAPLSAPLRGLPLRLPLASAASSVSPRRRSGRGKRPHEAASEAGLRSIRDANPGCTPVAALAACPRPGAFSAAAIANATTAAPPTASSASSATRPARAPAGRPRRSSPAPAPPAPQGSSRTSTAGFVGERQAGARGEVVEHLEGESTGARAAPAHRRFASRGRAARAVGANVGPRGHRPDQRLTPVYPVSCRGTLEIDLVVGRRRRCARHGSRRSRPQRVKVPAC